MRKSSTINPKAELALPNKDGIFRIGVTDYVIGESSGEKPPTRFWPLVESSVTEKTRISKMQKNFQNFHNGVRLTDHLN